VTFNDEPLSDSQQQSFDEFVQITETLDENGDPVVTVNVTPENLTNFQFWQELAADGGVVKVEVRGDESSDSDLIGKFFAVEHHGAESSDVVTLVDSLRAAKIGSQSPGVVRFKRLS